MRRINIDLDKYMVYENEDGDLYAAIDIKHQETMMKLYRNYDYFKSVYLNRIVSHNSSK